MTLLFSVLTWSREHRWEACGGSYVPGCEGLSRDPKTRTAGLCRMMKSVLRPVVGTWGLHKKGLGTQR